VSPTGSTDSHAPGLVPRWAAWLSLPLTALYAVAVLAAEGPDVAPLVSVLGAALVFLLSVGLYLLLPTLVWQQERWSAVLIAESLLTVVLLIVGETLFPVGLRPLLAIVVASSLLGQALRSGFHEATAYWLAAGALVAVTVGFGIFEWPRQIEIIREAAPLIAGDVISQVRSLGLEAGEAEQMTTEWTKRIQLAGWLLPSVMTMTALIPMNLGGLWFLSRRARFLNQATPLAQFTRWTVSRWTLVPVAVALSLHFVEPDSIRLVADNLLFGLALASAIIGTSGLEWLLRKLKIPGWGRAIAYVIIAITHLYGLALLVALGLMDTLLGVRRRLTAPMEGQE